MVGQVARTIAPERLMMVELRPDSAGWQRPGMFDPGAVQSHEDNVSKLTNYCYNEKNFKVPIMKAVEQVLGGRK